MKKAIVSSIIFLILLLFIAYGVFFFDSNPEERARMYINRAFAEYKAAIRKNPGNKELFNEYASILKARRGEIKAKVELALFFHEMGMDQECDNLLLEVVLKDKEKTVGHLEHLISEAKSPEKRIELYSTTLKILPENGGYWYRLGRLYLGMNRQEEGIEALEKAYSLDVREEDLFYYLGSSLIQRGDYKKAEFYVGEGLKEKDSVELHKLRYNLYSRQKKQEFATRD